MQNILLLDNNDSFTYNIVELIRKAGICGVDTVNSNDCKLSKALKYKKIIFSPGPGIPDDFPIMKSILSNEKFNNTDILGVCLGFQTICEYFGGKLINKLLPAHGEKQSLEITTQSKLFDGIKNGIDIGLYHSWEVVPQTIQSPIEITAISNNSVMAIQHKNKNIFGVQFHPESYMSSNGIEIITNFIKI